MKYLKILFVLLTISFRLQAQNIDSMVNVIKKMPDDTNKLNAYAKITAIAPDGVWQTYNIKMGELSEKLAKSRVPSINIVAKRLLALCYNNKGYDFTLKGDYRNALDALNTGIRIQKEINDIKNLWANYTNIGALYDRNGDLDKAMENYKLALDIMHKINNVRGMPSLLNNLAVIYSKKKETKKHFDALKQGEEILEKYPDVQKIAGHSSIYASLGLFYEQEENYEKALEYYNKCLKISSEIGDNKNHSSVLQEIAHLYFTQNKIRNAEELAKKSLFIAKENGYKSIIKDDAKLLKEIYLRNNNYKLAYEMHVLEITYRDSLKSKENQKAVLKSQFQYEYDIKEAKAKIEQEKNKEISKREVQKQKLIRNGFIVGFVFMVFFAGIFFKQRNKIKNGKKQSDELLLNILPAEVADELKERGQTTAKHFEEVTVMFTDFVEFTKIGEKLSPQILVQELHECFSAFDAIIERNGLEKIKTVGDAYIAVCGLPVVNENHAEKTVKAAIEILQFMEDRKKQEKVFEIRIGIHTGPVVAGIVGVKKFAYDIWGDTVNTAARMESSSEAGKINISETTYALVKDKFSCTHRGKISAKGKGEIDMYFVENQ